MDIDQRYPSIPAFERVARRRMPVFAAEYLFGGIGAETCLRQNRDGLNSVKLRSRHICNVDNPDFGSTLFGQKYLAPFGVAPIGLSGLMWPRAAEHMAASAKSHNLPFVLSNFATTDIETAFRSGGENIWFQLYPTKAPEIENDLLKRINNSGYQVLVVTIDIPTTTRRERDIANGLSVPPQFNFKTIAQVATRPRWALQSLIDGVPQFETLNPYIPKGLSMQQQALFLTDMIEGHVSYEKLQRIRQSWEGKLVIKGVLDVEDAHSCVKIGADAIVVSNHGGRQLDASPHALDVLGDIRQVVGEEMPIIVDGGIRSGLDIARVLASGANFALMGRPFVCATAAAGRAGCEHAMAILKNELGQTMRQIGCEKISDLPAHLISGRPREIKA